MSERRAQAEKKVEEATVRLLRALEVMGRVRLAERGFQFERIDPDRLHSALKMDFVKSIRVRSEDAAAGSGDKKCHSEPSEKDILRIRRSL